MYLSLTRADYWDNPAICLSSLLTLTPWPRYTTPTCSCTEGMTQVSTPSSTSSTSGEPYLILLAGLVTLFMCSGPTQSGGGRRKPKTEGKTKPKQVQTKPLSSWGPTSPQDGESMPDDKRLRRVHIGRVQMFSRITMPPSTYTSTTLSVWAPSTDYPWKNPRFCLCCSLRQPTSQ